MPDSKAPRERAASRPAGFPGPTKTAGDPKLLLYALEHIDERGARRHSLLPTSGSSVDLQHPPLDSGGAEGSPLEPYLPLGHVGIARVADEGDDLRRRPIEMAEEG